MTNLDFEPLSQGLPDFSDRAVAPGDLPDFSDRARLPGQKREKPSPVMETVSEFGKGVAAGAIESVGTAVGAGAALDPTEAVNRDIAKYRDQLIRVPKMSEQELADFRQSLQAEPYIGRRILELTVDDLLSGKMMPDEIASRPAPTPMAERPLYKTGEEISAKGAEWFPAEKGWDESLVRTFGKGFGSLVSGGVASAINPAAGGALFGAMGIGEAQQRAIDFDRTEKAAGRQGLSEEQILTASILGVGPGTTDTLPVEAILGRLRVPLPFRKPLARAIGRIGGQAVIEGVQEGGQEYLQNLIAQEVYNPDQDLTEGVVPSAGVGAGVGLGAQALTETAKLLVPGRSRGRASPPVEPAEPAAPDFSDRAVPADAVPAETLYPEQEAPPETAAAEEAGAPAEPSATGAEPAAPAPAAAPLVTEPDILAPPNVAEPAEAVEPATVAPEQPLTKPATKAEPATVETAADLEAATATPKPEPTEAQKEAGNYPKDHIRIQGLDIAIENAKGSERAGIDSDGEAWAVTMPAAYGYAKRTAGADGDQVDVYVGDEPASTRVFVIDQNDAETGAFDEHKAMVGFPDIRSAMEAYVAGFSDGRGSDRLGGITPMDMEAFKRWLREGETSKPLSYRPEAPQAAPETPPPIAATETPATLPVAAQPAPEPAKPARRQKPGKPRAVPLNTFLKNLGGIREEAGELKAMNLHRRFPGLVNNKTGLPHDRARELAAEAGYFDHLYGTPERAMAESTVADLRALLADADTAFSGADEELVAESRAQEQTRRDEDRLDGLKADVRAFMDEMGLEPDQAVIDRAAAMLLSGEAPNVGLAFEAAAIQIAEETAPAEDVADAEDTVPGFFGPKPSQEGRDQGGEPVRREAQEGAGRPASAPVASREAAPSGGQDEGAAGGEGESLGSVRPEGPGLFTEETGADNKPQTVLPGAERISQKEQAQRKADERLKPKKAQKPADEGLFGDEKDQTDLVDLVSRKGGGETLLSNIPRAPATDTPAFKRWFGDSKVVDENGEPLVVYHGSNRRFNVFRPKPGMRNEGGPVEVTSSAFFFTPDRATARMFARDRKLVDERIRNVSGGQPLTRAFYLSAQNPLDLVENERRGFGAPQPDPEALQVFEAGFGVEPQTWEDVQRALDDPKIIDFLQREGFDGVRLREPGGSESWAVFEPNQIKSTENRGTFDPDNPSILAKTQPTPEPRVRLDEKARSILAARLRNRVKAIAGADTDVWTFPTISAEGVGSPQYEADMARSAEAGGYERADTAGGYVTMHPDGRAMVALALEDPDYDPDSTAYHEAYHRVEGQLMTDAEMATLSSPEIVAKARELAAEELGRDPAEFRELPGYEARAIAFERYARLRDQGEPISRIRSSMPAPLLRLFDRIRRALAEVKRVLTGLGYTRIEDIFEEVYQGRMADRPRTYRSLTELEKAVFGEGAEARIGRVNVGGESYGAIRVYHGSPHDFDRFDMSKIGTGEGAQAYGHGLYFAESPAVANEYRKRLGRPKTGKFSKLTVADADDWVKRAGSRDAAIGQVEGMLSFEQDPSLRDQLQSVLAYLREEKPMRSRTYEVTIKATPDDFLDWDKPLSEQPEKISAAIRRIADRRGIYSKEPGGSLLNNLRWQIGLETATQELRAAGIKGIRYKDAGSRGYRVQGFYDGKPANEVQSFPTREAAERRAAEYRNSGLEAKIDEGGTYNYVVFDDSILEITGKDGQPVTLPTEEQTLGSVIPSNDKTSPFARGGNEARQEAISAGFGVQPIDRVIRIPFQIFGGLNEKGEWKPGLYLSKTTGKLLTSATFSDQGRFAWANPILRRARLGLIDRYGLDPEYVERERQRGLDERGILAEVPEIMQTLRDKDVGPAEARVLQAILTGEKTTDADWKEVAEPIREAVDQMGAEAVELGLLSAEAFERNRGSYLHRVYQKHEADDSSLGRWFSHFMGKRRQKIIGEQFKGRGLWMEVGPTRLGAPTDGKKYRILDKLPEGDGSLKDADPDTFRKAVKRVYVAADQAVPEQYAGWTDRGVWEVRGKKRGQMILWRDFTKAEREKMGEITDARYTIAKTWMSMAHDLATGRFYKDISQNADWATDKEPREATWKEAGEYGRFWADPTIEWVRVPDTFIPKSRTKRYGALAGKFVRAEIWRDINELDQMQRSNWWKALLNQWKLNKTARNPVVHMNNIMSNLVLMDMADVRASDLARAIRSMARGDDAYKEAVANGAFGADMVSVEIRRSTLQPLLEEIEADMRQGSDGMAKKAKLLTKLANAIWSKAKNLDRKMVDLYRMEDEVFRMATFLRRRGQGATANDAAIEAKDQFLDYDIRAPWVNAARRSVLPFISYTYRAVPLVAKTVMTRPWKLAKYFLLAYGANALSYMLFPGDEDKERRSMREEMQGYTWIGAPRTLRLPWGDPYGNPMFLDIRRWIPAGDVFDTNQGQSPLPIPAPLQFGGPIQMAFEVVLNKQAFTGDPITNELTDDWWDQTSKISDWAWKSWMPSAAWVPGSWYWEKIGRAAAGARDWGGTPYSVPEAVASSFGVKVRPQDVEEGFRIRGLEFDRVERELKSELGRLMRDRARGLLSQSQFERARSRAINKLKALDEKRRKVFTGK